MAFIEEHPPSILARGEYSARPATLSSGSQK